MIPLTNLRRESVNFLPRKKADMNVKQSLPTGINIFGLHIQFYAIFILCGALLAFFLSSYRAHKKGYPWDFFEIIFFTAFPAGIVGARIWYVIAEWNKSFAGGSFWDVFKIWNGGLAIQGGIIGGVIVGVLMIKFFRKGAPILEATDFAVPTIFVAQAIGRWGNFFNQEVFGAYVSRQSWSFLPDFILKQMAVDTAPAGQIAVPLFLIEGVLNIGCYYILAHGLPAVFGKRYRHGDITFAYFILYGIIRMFMEPLRNSAYQMGNNQNASFAMAIAFVIIGFVLIALNHFIRAKFSRKNTHENAKSL